MKLTTGIMLGWLSLQSGWADTRPEVQVRIKVLYLQSTPSLQEEPVSKGWSFLWHSKGHLKESGVKVRTAAVSTLVGQYRRAIKFNWATPSRQRQYQIETAFYPGLHDNYLVTANLRSRILPQAEPAALDAVYAGKIGQSLLLIPQGDEAFPDERLCFLIDSNFVDDSRNQPRQQQSSQLKGERLQAATKH